jgi:hypothetical protein
LERRLCRSERKTDEVKEVRTKHGAVTRRDMT